MQAGLFGLDLNEQGEARANTGSSIGDAVTNDLMDFINPLDIGTGFIGTRFIKSPNKNTGVGYASNVVEGQYGERKRNKFTGGDVRANPTILRSMRDSGAELNETEMRALENYDNGYALIKKLNKLNEKVQRSNTVLEPAKKIVASVANKAGIPEGQLERSKTNKEFADKVLDKRAARRVYEEWLPEAAATGIKAVFNPVDRAMIAQHGISRDNISHIKSALERLPDVKSYNNQMRLLHEGVASLQHTANMAARFGDDISTLAEPVQKLIKGSLVGEKYHTLNTESYLAVDSKVKRKKADDTEHVVETPVKKKLLDFAVTQWNKAGAKIDFSGKWKMAYKEPDNIFSGRHTFDFRQLSYPAKVMRNYFKENPNVRSFNDTDELIKALGTGGKQVNIIAKDETGVYVAESFAGSAITEGGVNVVTKINLDGTADSLMSDVYDYMEKSVGKPIEVMSKHKLISLSGFSTDFKTTSKESSNITNSSKGDKRMKDKETKAALDEIIELKPSRQEVLKQVRFAVPRAGIIATDTTMLQESQEENNKERKPTAGMLSGLPKNALYGM